MGEKVKLTRNDEDGRCPHGRRRGGDPCASCDKIEEAIEAAYAEGWNAAIDHADANWRTLIKSVSETARTWAVRMGGNTPLAIIATLLRELVEPHEGDALAETEPTP